MVKFLLLCDLGAEFETHTQQIHNYFLEKSCCRAKYILVAYGPTYVSPGSGRYQLKFLRITVEIKT